jgi:hypothetical protein
MNRKDKINLINQLEIGELSIEIFQRPKLCIRNVQISDYRRSRQISHDEDIFDLNTNNSISAVNPYTGDFYGLIFVNIIK